MGNRTRRAESTRSESKRSDHMTLVGRPAPEFQMPCTVTTMHPERETRLSEYRGSWLILLFYPRDFSLVCPTELTAIGERITEFETHGCRVLAVSTDPVATHERWIATPRDRGGLGGVSPPLASDESGDVSSAYGVYLEHQHVALRGLFIIDTNGVVQYESVHNLNVGRSSDEVVRILEALQTGGMCPEDWCAGCPTLDPTETLGPGRVVSHYRIEEEVGRGSSASVFRAFDTLLERTVALKAFKPDALSGEHGMLAEASAAAALNHPNVCTIYGVDDDAGIPLIVMEYVDGETLASKLVDNGLTGDDARSILRQVAAGMAAAHDIGVVHGDLKPSNIMLTKEGTPKITDFGLSRRELVVLSSDDTGVPGLDSERGISGTPNYMSPEQTNGVPASAAGDVFALGAVAYEMATGRQAFSGGNILEVFHKIREVDPEHYAADLPGSVAKVVKSALVPDRRERTITMAAIVEALA